MHPQQYEEFSAAYSSVASRLGLGHIPFSREIYDEFMGRCEYWTVKAYWILKKLQLTLDRLEKAGDPKHTTECEMALGRIRPLLENHLLVAPEKENWPGKNSRAHWLLGSIEELGGWEAFLRNAAFGKNLVHLMPVAGQEDKLRIGSITVTEKCKLGCDYCSIDAKASGMEMNLDLFPDLFASRQIAIDRLYLGDGEILTHRDHRLAGVIRRLITEYGIAVTFTTAGLLPENERTGRMLLKGLEGLGAYAEDLRITVSFNLLNPLARADPGVYIGRMERTFAMVAALMRDGNGIPAHVMYDDSSPDTSARATFEALGWALNGIKSTGGDMRKVGLTGRAIGRYGAGEEQKKDERQICGNMKLDGPLKTFRVLPGGDVAPNCLNPGAGGAVLGNIYENDVGQIRVAYKEFIGRFAEHRGRNTSVDICEAHRTCGITVRPPQSDNPIAKWSMRPCEPRRLHARR